MANDATVDITTASRTLGLSVEALRKRLQRGAARGFKAPDGTWRVYVDDTEGAGGNGADTSPVAGLAAEVSTLREDVRVLKSHLGDLRRALEETVSGRSAGPSLPSLASPRHDDDPILEQPDLEPDPAGQPLARVLPSIGDGFTADATPWGDEGADFDAPAGFGGSEGFGPEDGPEEDGDASDPFWPPEPEGRPEMEGRTGPDSKDAVAERERPLHSAENPGAVPGPAPAPAIDEEALQALIATSVEDKMKPVLQILQEALLAMRRSR